MEIRASHVLFVALMIVTIVAVDFLFLRHQIGKRLIGNIAIVVVFALIYLRFLRHS
ncbi:MAG: hypothetical protein V9F06_01150 [Thermomicrobiales bacterium]|jgi:hypothetical protein|nr:hypothetical protein [Thermomicrobiales bacterium]